LQVFRSLGHRVKEARLPDFPWFLIAKTLIDVGASAAFENLIRGPRLNQLLDPSQQAGLLAGLAIPGVNYLRASRIRTLASAAALPIFERFDALIAPTLLQVAPSIGKRLSEFWDELGYEGAAVNLLGWPGIAIPMGAGQHNLPLGMELIGPPYGEARLLALA